MNNTTQKEKKKLTIKEKAFCREYAKTGNGTQSVKKAGYKAKNDNNAHVIANRLLQKVMIQDEITRITGRKEKKAIMDSQELMELYSAIARGEVKDQFGLDANLGDRIKAMNELAKRTIDIDNRMKGIPDQNNQININVHWRKKK